MRIEGPYGLEPRGAQEARSGSPRKIDTSALAVAANAEDPQVLALQQQLSSQAAAQPEVRVDAVEQAKLLLASGELDSPEAARRAAKAILELGL